MKKTQSWIQKNWIFSWKNADEASWYMLPEDTFELIDRDPALWDKCSKDYILQTAVTNTKHDSWNELALRLIGILAEENILDKRSVVSVVRKILNESDNFSPHIIRSAIACAWQSHATDLLVDLKSFLKIKSGFAYSDFLFRAIAVLNIAKQNCGQNI